MECESGLLSTFASLSHDRASLWGSLEAVSLESGDLTCALSHSATEENHRPGLPNCPTSMTPQRPDPENQEKLSPEGKSLLPIEFTGSGGEYFRIWIVNLLLTLLTLGFYYPFAKVRRQRYMLTNTRVGGHALDYHANPWQLLRGYVLVGALLGGLRLASSFSITLGQITALLIWVLWPAFLYSSMRFRLRTTSWRGLRFHFTGTLAEAYKTFLPLLPPLLLLGATAWRLAADLSEKKRPEMSDLSNGTLWWILLAVIGIGYSLATGPWIEWRVRRFQHDHYALGSWTTRWQAAVGSFYGVYLKTAGLAVVSGLLVGALSVLGMALQSTNGLGNREAGILAVALGVMLAVVINSIVQVFFSTRMQNILWNGTGGAQLQFRSNLRFTPMLQLTLKNTLLTLLSLGLYRPFAVIAKLRMQLESISIETAEDPATLHESLLGTASRGDTPVRNSTGEVGSDLLGIDIGF
ncbi:MAG: hypothetical protein RLZZ399_1035 [Verrucomicrobiota bacterium]|jgi:uncharacterized membrane protein YjgN (DUF898 family)